MNVVLVTTFDREVYSHITGNLDPPLGLTYIASSLIARGHRVSIIDAEAENLNNHDDLAQEVARREPDIVGFGFTTPMIASVRRSVEKIREAMPDIPIVAGGPHATVEPERMVAEGIADYSVIGEGEETMAELVDRLSFGAGIDDCPGLCYREGDRPVSTARRRPVANLDVLPLPARHLLRIERYKSASSLSCSRSSFYTTIISSRGCPFKCIFCGSIAVFGNKLRCRQPDHVADEIEECLRRYGIVNFGFVDDTLTLKKSHILGICEAIAKRALDITWRAQGRVDAVDEEILRAMKRAGCEAIHYGYESGNQEILDRIKKGTTVEQAIRATELAKRERLKIHGYFMIGNPGETPETISDTIELAKKLDPDSVQFSLAQPFPGTQLYEIARQSGRLNREFENFKWYESVNFVPKGMTEEEILKFHRRAFKEFYFRPSYIIKTLTQLRHLSNWRWVINGIRSFFSMMRG